MNQGLSWTTTDLMTTLTTDMDPNNNNMDMNSKYMDSKNKDPKIMDFTLSSLDTKENTMAITGNLDEFSLNHEGLTGFKEQVQRMENTDMDYGSTRAFTNQVRIYQIIGLIKM